MTFQPQSAGQPAARGAGQGGHAELPETQEVLVTAGAVTLDGLLAVPEGARGIVVFAHGSGSSRWSGRNHYVAQELQHAGLGTLLFDLLTTEEERVDLVTRHLRFDIGLLADRVVYAAEWVRRTIPTADLRLGVFGASTGGGAALVAAAARPEAITAVVSRGGRPDLAGEALGQVRAPTLLIVGGADTPVIAMNQTAYDALDQLVPEREKRLAIVPGATHLFEEPGTLEQVAALARDWFARWLMT